MPIDASAMQEERELVLRAQAGDRHALGALLTRFGPMLYRSVLLPRLGNAVVAEQALGDTYTRVMEGLAAYAWRPPGIYPWLRTIALHVAIDLLRKRRHEVLFEPEDLERELDAPRARGCATDDPVAGWMEESDRQAAQKKLRRALEAINPRYAAAIRMRVIEDRPRLEVAAELGVTPATFDVLLHRAVAALRRVCGAAEDDTGPSSDASGPAQRNPAGEDERMGEGRGRADAGHGGEPQDGGMKREVWRERVPSPRSGRERE